MKDAYFILEVASTHGGRVGYLDQLMLEFERFDNAGIKFQPFRFDRLASPDYKGYETYRKLALTDKQWGEITEKASQTKEVWLDIFDEFSVLVFREQFSRIKGFKLQASVLGNFPLIRSLGELGLSNKICILNISGYQKDEITRIVRLVESELRCKIVLQVGFQAHPTQFIDSGLSKFEWLRSNFPSYELSFTDHLESTTEDALVIPVIGHICGARIIEKHIKCEALSTEYDHYSSVTHGQMEKIIDLARRYDTLFSAEFINKREEEYLTSSMLVPVLKENMNEGDTLSRFDFDYKRTSKRGLTSVQLFDSPSGFRVLANDVAAGSALTEHNLRPARIGAIIACRMKSSRLPRKALKKIGALTSIELCIKNTLQFANVDEVVLATSTHADDAVLKDYTYSSKVKFFQGSEDDVIDRFLSVAKLYSLDVIIRVTGDSPYRSDDVLQILLRQHFDNGADYTAAGNAAIGTNIEVINVKALKRVYELFGGTPYSEYMSYYFKNNPTLFKIQIVQLPEEFANSFRLTLDYEEDLHLFSEIERHFNHATRKFDALSLYEFLRQNPDVAQINSNCEIAYKDDSDLLRELKEKTTYKVSNK